jgi:starch synthase
MIRVLSVTSECAPLVKTGGLADVAGALPAALAGQGVEMKTLLPGYPAVMERGDLGEPVLDEQLFGGAVRVRPARMAGLDMLVLDAPHLYDRPGGPYLTPDGHDFHDNPERFAALSYMAARLADTGIAGWMPDVLHCHDWQAGLAPLYLRDMGLADRVKSVLTIHNVAFHGLAPRDRRAALRLPIWADHSEGIEFYGQISALKAGIVFANRVTTVSPTYAAELMTPSFGMGLEGVLQTRSADLVGILNGIDMEAWNPETDPAIAPYSAPEGKAPNKAALLEEFGLSQGDGPLAIVVSRLTGQKGLDVLPDALAGFIARGGRLALLGSGAPELEDRWRHIAASNDGVGVRIGYDEALSHRMMAGADAILVPSRFEPCGLTQLYALRYGTIPVVARTGGLADTVIHANDAALRAGVATGLQFGEINVTSLSTALVRLTELYSDPGSWEQMQRNAMRHPVGWESSAADYAALYQGLVPTP